MVPDDYYAALIRERGDSQAAILLADECRKKDEAMKQMREALECIRDHAPGTGPEMDFGGYPDCVACEDKRELACGGLAPLATARGDGGRG